MKEEIKILVKDSLIIVNLFDLLQKKIKLLKQDFNEKKFTIYPTEIIYSEQLIKRFLKEYPDVKEFKVNSNEFQIIKNILNENSDFELKEEQSFIFVDDGKDTKKKQEDIHISSYLLQFHGKSLSKSTGLIKTGVFRTDKMPIDLDKNATSKKIQAFIPNYNVNKYIDKENNMNNDVVISSTEDILLYVDRAIEDLQKYQNQEISISDDFKPVLDLTLKGDNFNSSITAPVMSAFITLQNEILRIYALNVHGSPNLRLISKEERDKLEFVVKVHQGSSWYELDLTEIFKEVIRKMDKKGILIIASMASILVAGNIGRKTYIESKQVELENKRVQLEQDRLAAETEEDKREKEYQLSIIDKMNETYQIASAANKEVYKDLAKSSFTTLKVDSQTYTNEEIEEISKAPKVAKKTRQYSIRSEYKILKLYMDFQSDNKYIDVEDIKTGNVIKKVGLQTDWLAGDDYKIIENAVNTKNVALEIYIVEQNEKIISAAINTEEVKLVTDDDTALVDNNDSNV